ncbi:MAG: hypothetical protein JO252_25305 [Planctomycetaceae bacterium]|jgi:hypothetical protein|nr:hypothetical protein [Planctomycetaceae bacterium]MBV8382167.1 hypothetical protein [Planctomycetaceae bacterium]MBV8611220.1 hypothetical protein [Singulisphaera sp.]
MASKEKRGLPPGYDLNIPDSEANKPVQLGDYLEEVDPGIPRVPKPAPRQQRGENKIIEMPRSSERHDEVSPAAPPEEAKAGEAKPSRRHRRKHSGPARKQINATPETLRMVDEIIDYVQTYSVQKDAKASEVFHALVLALYEARESIDLSEVPARGRWGTPTAKAFPISLKNAFQEAIVSEYRKNRR